jgi:hypothetical protein
MTKPTERAAAGPGADTPPWRRNYDTLEAAVAERLEQMVSSEQFAKGLAAVMALRRDLERRASTLSRRVLHGFNLPAGSDIGRLLTEIGELRKQVREMSERLDDIDGPTGPTGVRRGHAGS